MQKMGEEEMPFYVLQMQAMGDKEMLSRGEREKCWDFEPGHRGGRLSREFGENGAFLILAKLVQH